MSTYTIITPHSEGNITVSTFHYTFQVISSVPSIITFDLPNPNDSASKTPAQIITRVYNEVYTIPLTYRISQNVTHNPFPGLTIIQESPI